MLARTQLLHLIEDVEEDFAELERLLDDRPTHQEQWSMNAKPLTAQDFRDRIRNRLDYLRQVI